MSRAFEIKNYKTNNELKTLEINGYLLHSKYDPEKEAERIFNKQYELNYLHILFGYGVGHIANKFKMNMNGESKLLIIDPLLQELNISDNDVYDFIDTQGLKELIVSKLNYWDVKVKVIVSPNYDRLFPNELKSLLLVVNEIQKLNIVSENTSRLFALQWQKNYIQNLVYLENQYSLVDFNNLYDYPVVIVSGGPSLTKQLDNLKKIENRAIIIAAGSTFNSLLNYNIMPHFIVSIDGGELNYKHYEKHFEINTNIIYCLSNHYKIQSHFTGKKIAFLMKGHDELQHFLKDRYNVSLPMIPGGASAANFSFSIAKRISTGPIAFIGQDLAFTNNFTHAENNENRKKIDTENIEKNNLFFEEGYYGDKVLTNLTLFSMKRNLEELYVSEPHSAEVFNCTEGGIKLKGFNQIEFKEFCEKYCENNISLVYPTKKNEINNLIDGLKKELETYNKIDRILNEIIELLFEVEKIGYFKVDILSKIDILDGRLKKCFSKVCMSIIVDPISLTVLKDFQPAVDETIEDEFKRVLKQNFVLYKSNKEAAEITRKYTLEVLNEQLKIKK